MKQDHIFFVIANKEAYFIREWERERERDCDFDCCDYAIYHRYCVDIFFVLLSVSFIYLCLVNNNNSEK